MTQGHFVTLSPAQFQALSAQLARTGGEGSRRGIFQWAHLADGRRISEKDPGYPFLAAPFQALGIIRWAPLFYGALGCAGLFFGARRWLGRWGGAAAVGLFCSSGAALLFAWRDYMPTFTEASLIAAGTGALVWAVLAASWFSVWGLYAAYTWTTQPGLNTLQAVRFYVPAIGAIALLGAWLLVRVPRKASLAAVTTAAVVVAMFGLGHWSYNTMREFRLPGPRRARPSRRPPSSGQADQADRQATPARTRQTAAPDEIRRRTAEPEARPLAMDAIVDRLCMRAFGCRIA